MTLLALAALGGLELVPLWASSQAGTDWLLSAVPQLGAIAILLWFGNRMLVAADKRTEQERLARIAAEADSRAVRDALIQDMVPAMTLQTARSEALLSATQRVVELVERVMMTALEKPR